MEDVTKRLAAVDLNLLVSLHTLLRMRSVTAAAEHLAVTQSTMSHQLARLRSVFDDPLLVRKGNEMHPTARALLVQNALAGGLKALDSVLGEPGVFRPEEAQGEVVLACTDWASTQYVPFVTRWFASEAPGLRLRVEALTMASLVQRLDWDVDLAVVCLRDERPPDRSLVLSEEHLVGVCGSGHPFAAAAPDHGSWVAEPWVEVGTSVVDESVLEVVRAAADPSLKQAATSYYLSLPQLLEQMGWIAAVPARTAWGLVQDHGLATFALPIPQVALNVSLLWSPLRAAEPRLRWLRRRLAELVDGELARRSAIRPVPG